MTELEAMEARGWKLTTQGYVWRAWRIYQAETWCCAFREFLVRNRFASAIDAADWIDSGADQHVGPNGPKGTPSGGA